MGATRSLLRFVVLGRRNGFRASLRRAVGLGWIDGAAEAEERPAPTPPPGERSGGVVAGGRGAKEPPKDVTPPEGFEVVLHRDALEPGELTEVIIGGTAMAVANVDGTFHAIDNVCPHAGGPLGDGTLDGTTVTCPYHGWTFDVTDGRCHVDEDARVRHFEVRVVGDAVCVRM